MATKAIKITSWEANQVLLTANESNIAHADYTDTIEITFATAKPACIEIQIQHDDLNQVDGFAKFYQQLSDDTNAPAYMEIVNADALPEPLPVPLDSAANNFSVFLWQFTGKKLKINFTGTSTAGTFKVAIGGRNV